MDNELTNNKSEILQLYKAEFNDVADEFCIKLGSYGMEPSKAMQTVVGEYKEHRFCACLIKEPYFRTGRKKNYTYKYCNYLICSLKSNSNNLPNFHLLSNKDAKKGCTNIITYAFLSITILFISLFVASVIGSFVANLTNSKEAAFTTLIIIMISMIVLFISLIKKISNQFKLKLKHKWFQDKYILYDYDNKDAINEFFNSDSLCRNIDKTYEKYGEFSIQNNNIQMKEITQMTQSTILNLLKKIIVYTEILEKKEI